MFAPDVTSTLRFIRDHEKELCISGFHDSLPTIHFMEMMYKWFVLHNIKSPTAHVSKRDALRMPFCSGDDER